MNEARMAWKVGLFVAVSLAVLAGLLIRFSKGVSWVTPTYNLYLKTGNVGGIKKGATVLMADVPIGTVRGADLTPDGHAVIIQLRILKRHPIHGDASFVIEQAGFLGDQYVSITPGKNLAPLLEDGATNACEEPFNIQEAARAATAFLRRADNTIEELNTTVSRLDRILLSEQNLTNISVSIANFRQLSARLDRTIGDADDLLTSNAPAIRTSVSNFTDFSRELDRVAGDLHQLVVTNGDQATAAISNIHAASATLNQLLGGLQSGQGVAGGLLKDQQLKLQFQQTVSNLSVLSSNLSRFGIFYKPRRAAPPAAESFRPAPPPRPSN